ncbi:uncharacterized protein LOC116988266 [Amblyraja radiata]|uniref:uncharacterized protein LOC116988266 n=1 Tax=Amblyraja radiata TaxID=386614 RepID=UPI0014031E84|nr:uncharacterized protein LOC116988266 [Amblyraja radiata]
MWPLTPPSQSARGISPFRCLLICFQLVSSCCRPRHCYFGKPIFLGAAGDRESVPAVRSSGDGVFLSGPPHLLERAAMVLSYSPRWELIGDSLLRRELLLGSHQRFHSQDAARWTSTARGLRSPRCTGHLDMETLAYPSYHDYQHHMLVQFPVLHRTWRSCLGKVTLESFHRSRLGLKDYWTNPQRAYSIGCLCRNTRKHVLVLPGNTGISDVDSTITPGLCQYRHKLIWKYRWQKLREDHLASKLRASSPSSRGGEFQWLHRAAVRS